MMKACKMKIVEKVRNGKINKMESNSTEDGSCLRWVGTRQDVMRLGLTHYPSTKSYYRVPIVATATTIQQSYWKTSWSLVGERVRKFESMISRTGCGALRVSLLGGRRGGGGGCPAPHVIAEQPAGPLATPTTT